MQKSRNSAACQTFIQSETQTLVNWRNRDGVIENQVKSKFCEKKIKSSSFWNLSLYLMVSCFWDLVWKKNKRLMSSLSVRWCFSLILANPNVFKGRPLTSFLSLFALLAFFGDYVVGILIKFRSDAITQPRASKNYFTYFSAWWRDILMNAIKY